MKFKKIKELLKKNNQVKLLLLKRNWKKFNDLMKMDDETFAKKHYFLKTNKELNLENPQTFNEKIWYLKLNNRNPLLTVCTDKYLVRDYVKQCGLEHTLNTLYGTYSKADDIDFNNLPEEKVFFKTNHTSGYNALYTPDNNFDKKYFIKKFNFILNENYYKVSREWNYKNIKPLILMEKVFESKDLLDYRFFCFDGKVKIVFVDSETTAPDGTHFGGAKRNIYDKDLNFLDFTVGRENFSKELVVKPKNYDKMVQYAEKLSKPFRFVRVDMYNFDGEIMFGELTFNPGGGSQVFSSEEWAMKMGSWIDISNI